MRTISEQQVITKTTYTADGTTDIYSVPFEYLSKAHVIVTADGEAADYEWLSDHAVKFDTPPQRRRHTIRLSVRDAAGNIARYEGSFVR